MDRRTFNKLATASAACFWAEATKLHAESEDIRSDPERWSLWRCAPIPFPDSIQPQVPEAIAGSAIEFAGAGTDLTLVLPDSPASNYSGRALQAMVRLIRAKVPRSAVLPAPELLSQHRNGHLLVVGTPETNSFARSLIAQRAPDFMAGIATGGYHLRAINSPFRAGRSIILALGSDPSSAWYPAAILAFAIHPDRKGLTELHPWPVRLPAGSYWSPFEARYSPSKPTLRSQTSAEEATPPRIPFGVRIWGSPMPTLDSFARLIGALKPLGINTIAVQSGGWPDLPNAPELYRAAIDIAWRQGIFTILYAGNDIVSHKPAPLSPNHKAIVLAVKDHPGLLQWHLYNQLSSQLTPEQHRMVDEQIRWLKSVSAKPVGVEVVWGHDRAELPVDKLQLIDEMKASGISVVANDDAPLGGWSKRHDLSIWEPRLLQLRRCGLPMQAVLQAHIPFVDPTLPSRVQVRNQFWWAVAGGAQGFLFEAAYLFTDLSMRGILSWDLRPLPDGRYAEIQRLAGIARQMEAMLSQSEPQPDGAAEQMGLTLDYPDRAAMRLRRGAPGHLYLLLVNKSTEAPVSVKVSLGASGLVAQEMAPAGSSHHPDANAFFVELASGDGACFRLSAPRSSATLPLSTAATPTGTRMMPGEGVPFVAGALTSDHTLTSPRS